MPTHSTHALTALLFTACTVAAAADAPPSRTATAAVTADAAFVINASAPTEQSLELPAGFSHGEINMSTITGEAVCWPGDVFDTVLRVNVADHCPGSHSQRVGALAAEVALTRGAADHELYAIGMECSATGGTVNNCLEALSGDIVLDQGDLYANRGNMFAAGYVAAGTKLYAWGGDLELHHAGGWLAVRAYTAPPTDWAPRGSLALDVATPALWLSTGDGWKRVGGP